MMAARIRSRRMLLDSDSSTYLPPDDGLIGRTGASYTNEANFDTNMVIILAALLCAFICALGLNSILRCALNCSRRIVSSEENASLSTAGLKKSDLRKIPVAVYKASEINITATECPICLGEFVDGEMVRVLSRCNHGFHIKCIDTWLAAHSSCPTCRGSLTECSNESAVTPTELHVELPFNVGQQDAFVEEHKAKWKARNKHNAFQ